MNGKLAIAALAAFLFGCTVGSLAGFGVATLMGPRFEPRGHGPRRVMMRYPMSRDVEERLDLTPAQAERFHAVLEASRARYAAVRESTHAELDKLLTPKQREEFRSIDRRFYIRRGRGWLRDTSDSYFERRIPEPNLQEGASR